MSCDNQSCGCVNRFLDRCYANDWNRNRSRCWDPCDQGSNRCGDRGWSSCGSSWGDGMGNSGCNSWGNSWGNSCGNSSGSSCGNSGGNSWGDNWCF